MLSCSFLSKLPKHDYMQSSVAIYWAVKLSPMVVNGRLWQMQSDSNWRRAGGVVADLLL